MSGRIYPPWKILDGETLYCPNCHSPNIGCMDGQFTLFHDYKCYDCNKIFPKHKVVKIQEIRDIKIDQILKK